MTNINKKILQLIIEGKDVYQIMDALNLTYKQLHSRLTAIKDCGYNLSYNVFDDGRVRYELLKDVFLPAVNMLDVDLVKDSMEFTFLAVSDFHVTDKTDFYRMNMLYDYASKHGINIVVNCGDVINGCCNKEDEDVVRRQAAAFVLNHPFDKNILNLVTFGNHDFSALEEYGFDISNVICNERADFISLGFGTSLINVGTGQIIVSHPVKHAKTFKNKKWPNDFLARKLLLKGHGHHNSMKLSNKRCIVKVPTISDVVYTENSTIPGALKITIKLDKNGQFDLINVESLIFADGVKTVAFVKHAFSGSQLPLGEADVLNQKVKKLV